MSEVPKISIDEVMAFLEEVLRDTDMMSALEREAVLDDRGYSHRGDDKEVEEIQGLFHSYISKYIKNNNLSQYYYRGLRLSLVIIIRYCAGKTSSVNEKYVMDNLDLPFYGWVK